MTEHACGALLQVWLVRDTSQRRVGQQNAMLLGDWLLQLWTVVAPAFMWFRAVGM